MSYAMPIRLIWDNGGLVLCMNSIHACMQECIYITVYVCWCAACMCVSLVNDFINVKTETKRLICCEEIPTFYRQARFLLRLQILPRQLPHLSLT